MWKRSIRLFTHLFTSEGGASGFWGCFFSAICYKPLLEAFPRTGGWQDKVTTTKKQGGCLSMVHRRLWLLWHVHRMVDGCIPKTSRRQQAGHRDPPAGQPVLLFKFVCKPTGLEDDCIDTFSWESLADDPDHWRHVASRTDGVEKRRKQTAVPGFHPAFHLHMQQVWQTQDAILNKIDDQICGYH